MTFRNQIRNTIKTWLTREAIRCDLLGGKYNGLAVLAAKKFCSTKQSRTVDFQDAVHDAFVAMLESVDKFDPTLENAKSVESFLATGAIQSTLNLRQRERNRSYGTSSCKRVDVKEFVSDNEVETLAMLQEFRDSLPADLQAFITKLEEHPDRSAIIEALNNYRVLWKLVNLGFERSEVKAFLRHRDKLRASADKYLPAA